MPLTLVALATALPCTKAKQLPFDKSFWFLNLRKTNKLDFEILLADKRKNYKLIKFPLNFEPFCDRVVRAFATETEDLLSFPVGSNQRL